MSDTYSIVGWEKKFENCRTRQVKQLHWVSLPVAIDGDWFGFLMQRPNGLRNYGLYVALVQMAANTPVRGVLADDRGPFTPKRIAMIVRSTEDVVVEGLRILSDPDVGLLSRDCTTLHNSAQGSENGPVCMSVCPVVSVPETKPEQSSALRFVADRTLRSGGSPDGFKRFVSQYPKGHVKDEAGTLAVWTAQNLEPLAEQILSGLAKWLRCDGWVDGCVDGPIKFLNLRMWEKDPPPNRAKKGDMVPKAPPRPVNANAVCSWWMGLPADQKAAYAAQGPFTPEQVDGYARHLSPPEYIVTAWKGVAHAG